MRDLSLRTRALGGIALAATSALVLAGCASGSTDTNADATTYSAANCAADSTSENTFKVGTLLPVTGNLAFLGPAEIAGAGLAVADINAAGGVNGTDACIYGTDSGDSSDMSVSTASAEDLIKQKATVKARNAVGDTALRLAAFRGHLTSAELLIAGGAEVNMSGWTPLAYAAYNGHTDIAKLLIKSGADVNAATDNGSTALIIAAMGGHIEIVKLLLANRADPNKKLESGETALDIALKNQNTDIGDLLRKAGGRSGRIVTIEVR